MGLDPDLDVEVRYFSQRTILAVIFTTLELRQICVLEVHVALRGSVVCRP